MAPTTAAVAMGVGSQIMQNQIRQKAKGQKPPNPPDLSADAPSAARDAAASAAAGDAAATMARKRATAALGRNATILTGPAGTSTPAPTQRGTLLGL